MVKRKHKRKCPVCNGKGWVVDIDGMCRQCPKCKGKCMVVMCDYDKHSR
jgi:DnaJ-class molecular chaperone